MTNATPPDSFDHAYDPAAHCLLPDPPAPGAAALSRNRWGYEDTRFSVDANSIVRLSGDRYSLCGLAIDRLFPWAESQLGLKLDPLDLHEFRYPSAQPASRLNATQRAALL